MNTKDILQTLIKIPTISEDQAAVGQALDFIEKFVAERGMHVTRHEVNGVKSLVATTQKTKSPTVMLAGHIDVVPAPQNFFNLHEVDGILYGRGVHDMKGAISVFLRVVDVLRDDLQKYDFGLMITGDEEIGGFNGVAALLQKGYRPQVCILPDGGDRWKLETHAKGVICAEVTAYGKSAHGSRPWEGDNAIERLMTVLTDVKQHFPNTDKTASTMSIDQVNGGEAFNQIPDQASAMLDLRPATSRDQANIINLLEDICDTHGAELKLHFNESPCVTDRNNPYIKPFVESIEDVLGRPMESTTSLAGSDARHFAQYSIPCAVMYMNGGGHHSMAEWLEEKSLTLLEQATLQYLERVALLPEAAKSLTRGGAL